MMHALVFGGNGFIGSHLVDDLLQHGHAVRVFDKYPELYRAPLEKVDYVFGDFGNRGLVANALDGIDTVFHLISTTLPKTSNDDPIFDVQSNVVETLFLLEQCVLKKIKKFVYISSGGTIYGVPKSLPIQEDSPTFPLCSYGITKLCIEKYLEMFRNLYGLDYVVIRPSNPFGPRQNPKNIQGVISVFLGKSLKNDIVSVWGNGSVVRDYVYVKDLSFGIYLSSVLKLNNHIYNLGSNSGVSVTQIINEIENYLGRKVKVKYMKKRAFDIPAIYLDASRAMKDLGWRPKTDLFEGIALTAEFLNAIDN